MEETRARVSLLLVPELGGDPGHTEGAVFSAA